MRALSLRRTWRAVWKVPGLTILVLLTLAFGLAVWLATSSLVRAFEEDPLREVSGLYRVEIMRHEDLRRALLGTDMGFVAEVPQLVLSNLEVEAFARSSVPARVVPATGSLLPVVPEGAEPTLEPALFLGAQGFALFDLRIAAGRPFRDDSESRELVLSGEAARRWFGSDEAALGKQVRAGAASWQVVGVLADGASRGRRIHIVDGLSDPPVWLPFGAAAELGISPLMQHTAPPANGGMLHASLWVELPDALSFGEYARFAEKLARDRGHPPGSVRLRSYRHWSGVLGAPPTYRVFELFGFVVLLACAFTLTRLLHTRFHLRRGEMAVRRAHGASRGDVLAELLAEAGTVAALGALAGIMLSAIVLAALANIFPSQTGDIQLQVQRVILGLGLGIGVGLLAAIVPAWRLCREPASLALRRL